MMFAMVGAMKMKGFNGKGCDPSRGEVMGKTRDVAGYRWAARADFGEKMISKAIGDRCLRKLIAKRGVMHKNCPCIDVKVRAFCSAEDGIEHLVIKERVFLIRGERSCGIAIAIGLVIVKTVGGIGQLWPLAKEEISTCMVIERKIDSGKPNLL